MIIGCLFLIVLDNETYSGNRWRVTKRFLVIFKTHLQAEAAG